MSGPLCFISGKREHPYKSSLNLYYRYTHSVTPEHLWTPSVRIFGRRRRHRGQSVVIWGESRFQTAGSYMLISEYGELIAVVGVNKFGIRRHTHVLTPPSRQCLSVTCIDRHDSEPYTEVYTYTDDSTATATFNRRGYVLGIVHQESS